MPSVLPLVALFVLIGATRAIRQHFATSEEQTVAKKVHPPIYKEPGKNYPNLKVVEIVKSSTHIVVKTIEPLQNNHEATYTIALDHPEFELFRDKVIAGTPCVLNIFPDPVWEHRFEWIDYVV